MALSCAEAESLRPCGAQPKGWLRKRFPVTSPTSASCKSTWICQLRLASCSADIFVCKVAGTENRADLLTKGLGSMPLVHGLLFPRRPGSSCATIVMYSSVLIFNLWIPLWGLAGLAPKVAR